MIYFVRCGKSEFVKIGMAKNVVARLCDLQLSNPYPLTLLAVRDGDFDEERRIHRKFKADRHAGEWFVISDLLRAFIMEQVPADKFYDSLGGNVRRVVRLDASFIRAEGRRQALQGFNADDLSALQIEPNRARPAFHS